MKLVKSLLLGSAAGLTAVVGAQAADLPVQRAAPVEYVRVCTQYGAGFFFIPGTDTCLQITGRVRAEYLFAETFDRRSDGIGFLARGRLGVDARTNTEFGPLRAFFRYEITRTTGAYRTSGGPIGADGDPSQESTSIIDTGTNLDRAFVQFGGLTAGRLQSFFDFYANALAFSANLGSDRVTNVLAYTATVSPGLTFTIAAEDGIERRTFANFNSVTGIRNGELGGIGTVVNGVFFPASPILSGAAETFNTPARLSTLGGQTAPDGVANLDYTAAFGSARLSAAVHQVRGQALSGPVGGVRTGVVDTEYGFAVQGGVKINLPFIAAGDVLYLQAAYAEGAINYLGFGSSTSTGTLSPLRLAQTDGFINGRGNIELTEGFSVVAAFQHYFTPQLRAGLIGSYGQLDYSRSGQGVVTAEQSIRITSANGGPGSARLAGGRFGFVDTEEYRVEGNLIYSPVRDLDIGVDILYQNIDPKGRIVGLDRGAFDQRRRLVNDSDQLIGRLRIQRDF